MTDDASEPRIYLETPRVFEPVELAIALERLMETAPIACVRLSLGSDASEADWTLAANHLVPVCHGTDVPLLVTDHFRLVAPLGLDGVHLADGQTKVRAARDALGTDRIVGAFAGTSRHEGMVIAEAGADYVSFGPVGATGALGPDARAEDDLFTWWAEMIETPVVAEGACSLDDALRLAAHADFVVPDPLHWTAPDSGLEALLAYADALSVEPGDI